MLKPYSFRLDEELMKDFDKVCGDLGLDRSTLLRAILKKVHEDKFTVNGENLRDVYRDEIVNFNKKAKGKNTLTYKDTVWRCDKFVARPKPKQSKVVIIEGFLDNEVVIEMEKSIKDLEDLELINTKSLKRMNLGE